MWCTINHEYRSNSLCISQVLSLARVDFFETGKSSWQPAQGDPSENQALYHCIYPTHLPPLRWQEERKTKSSLHSHKTKKRSLTSKKENTMAIWELQCIRRWKINCVLWMSHMLLLLSLRGGPIVLSTTHAQTNRLFLSQRPHNPREKQCCCLLFMKGKWDTRRFSDLNKLLNETADLRTETTSKSPSHDLILSVQNQF